MKRKYPDIRHNDLVRYMKGIHPGGGWVVRDHEIEAEASVLPGNDQVIQLYLDSNPVAVLPDLRSEVENLKERVAALEHQ